MKRAFYSFVDHIELLLKPGETMEQIAGLANKLPEHAARMAAVITLVEDMHATSVKPEAFAAGVTLAQYYAGEALRLLGRLRACWPIKWLPPILLPCV